MDSAVWVARSSTAGQRFTAIHAGYDSTGGKSHLQTTTITSGTCQSVVTTGTFNGTFRTSFAGSGKRTVSGTLRGFDSRRKRP
jgi:hypothetical protein